MQPCTAVSSSHGTGCTQDEGGRRDNVGGPCDRLSSSGGRSFLPGVPCSPSPGLGTGIATTTSRFWRSDVPRPSQAVSAVGKHFANLVPPSLAATALAYSKEVDVLVTKKGELKTGKKQTGAAQRGGVLAPGGGQDMHLWVARARALCNTVGPGLPTEWLEGTQVWPQLRYNRLKHGTCLERRHLHSRGDVSILTHVGSGLAV